MAVREVCEQALYGGDVTGDSTLPDSARQEINALAPCRNDNEFGLVMRKLGVADWRVDIDMGLEGLKPMKTCLCTGSSVF